jgi:CRP/FNR family transcriptional regulator
MMKVEETPLFTGLNASALRTLRGRAVERRFAPDEMLFAAGAPARGLFIVLEGSVRVVRTRDGRQHVIHLEGPSGTLGEVPLYIGGGYPATAIAATDTRCAVIAAETLATMMVEDPRLSWRLLETLARRVRGLVERVDALATQDVATRLAAHLLARTVPVAGTYVATVDGTQVQLAEELGTVREVVVRHLRELQRGGVIRRTAPRRYEVMRLDALRSAAGVDG